MNSRSLRGGATTALAALMLSASVTVAPSAVAQDDFRIETAGGQLRVRTAPDGEFKRWIDDETPVSIHCQMQGPRVTGTFGTSTLWDKIGPGEFVSDAYVWTGRDGQFRPTCESSTTQPAPKPKPKPAKNKLLDYVDNYVGGYARQACWDAGSGRLDHYQCKQFVSCAVKKVYGRNIAGNYYTRYREAGFVRVSRAEARAGDIIQLNVPSARNSFPRGAKMHTAILASGFGGDEKAMVIDSNFGGDTRKLEVVRKHEWNPFSRARDHGLEVNIWRFKG